MTKMMMDQRGISISLVVCRWSAHREYIMEFTRVNNAHWSEAGKQEMRCDVWECSVIIRQRVYGMKEAALLFENGNSVRFEHVHVKVGNAALHTNSLRSTLTQFSLLNNFQEKIKLNEIECDTPSKTIMDIFFHCCCCLRQKQTKSRSIFVDQGLQWRQNQA